MASTDHGPASSQALAVVIPVMAWEAWAPALPRKSDWTRWASGNGGIPVLPGAPPVPEARSIPPLLRRRAGGSDRLGLEVASRLAQDGEALPAVFASRHGQIVRSVAMLEALARGEGPSPMDFSLSVHNTTAGIFSMSRGDRCAASAVSGGRESFSAGLLEALGLLGEGAKRVLVVYHDEEPPAPLNGCWEGEPGGWALGLLLGGEGPHRVLTQRLWDFPGRVGAVGDPGPQALEFARVLARGSGAARWTLGRHAWEWAFVS